MSLKLCLKNVFKNVFKSVFKTSLKRLKNVFKTSSKTSLSLQKRLRNVFQAVAQSFSQNDVYTTKSRSTKSRHDHLRNLLDVPNVFCSCTPIVIAPFELGGAKAGTPNNFLSTLFFDSTNNIDENAVLRDDQLREVGFGKLVLGSPSLGRPRRQINFQLKFLPSTLGQR